MYTPYTDGCPVLVERFELYSVSILELDKVALDVDVQVGPLVNDQVRILNKWLEPFLKNFSLVTGYF